MSDFRKDRINNKITIDFAGFRKISQIITSLHLRFGEIDGFFIIHSTCPILHFSCTWKMQNGKPTIKNAYLANCRSET